MANVKITELTALTAADSASTDVLPVVDVSADATKKLAISDLHRSVPDGTLSAPGIAFQSDLNSGLYRSGTDAIALVTNGAARILIDATGDVTIPNNLTIQGATTYAFAAGTAAAPSITFVDDSDTGLYSPSANQVAVATNGTGRLFVDANGNVGVGITPTTRFHVYQTGSTQAGLVETSQSASVLNFKSTGQSSGQPQLGCAASDMILNTNGSERLRITSTGSVGIGTTSPGTTLDVNGDAAFSANVEIGTYNPASSDSRGIKLAIGTSGSTLFIQQKSSATADNASFAGYYGTSQTSEINADGSAYFASNVGIGTTSPINYTNYVTLALSDSSGSVIDWMKGSTLQGSIYNAGDNFYFEAKSSVPMLFATNGAERMRIDSSGNVGIGTSSPTSYGNSQPTLVIEGSTNPAICWSDTGQTRDWWAVANGSNLSFNYADGGGSGSASNVTGVLSMTNSGNVGIGTTAPDTLLNLSSTGNGYRCKIDDTTNDHTVGIYSDATSARIVSLNNAENAYEPFAISSADVRFWIGSSEKARIDSSGRLLVGTSSADTVVNGKIQVSANDATASIQCTRTSANPVGPRFDLVKTRSGGIVQADDALGQIAFRGQDGLDTNTIGAAIYGYVDGTPSSNVMPGRLVFSTTADASSSPTERMRINSSGMHTITASNNSTAVQIRDASNYAGQLITATNGTFEINARTTTRFTRTGSASESMRITSTGQVGIGTSSPSALLHVSGGDITANQNLLIRGSDSNGVFIRNGANTAWNCQLQGNGNASFLGNVGIGTASPGRLLEVNNDGETFIRIKSSNTGNAGIEFGDQSDTVQGAIFQNSTDNSLRFNGYNNSEAMRIDSSGRVGIGTSSPANDIHILGTTGARIQNSADTDSQFLLTYSSNNPDFRMLDTTGTTTVKLLASGNSWFNGGNVGIGTTAPTSIAGYTGVTINNATNGGFIDLQSNETAVFRFLTNGTVNNIETRTATPIVFLINTNERARIDSSGRLLVGVSSSSVANAAIFQGNSSGSDVGVVTIATETASPANGSLLGILDFSDNGHKRAARIECSRDGGTWTSNSSHPSRLAFYTTADGESSPTERMRIDSDGKVGIGHSGPSKLLHLKKVGDDCHIRMNAGTGYRSVIGCEGSNILAFETGYNEHARIDSDGRLLIGGTSTADDNHANINANGVLTIRRAAASNDCIVIKEGSTESLLIEAAGNVYNYNVGSFAFTSWDNEFGTSGPYASLGSFGGEARISAGSTASDNVPLVFRTASSGTLTERMRIDSAGTVKINQPTYSSSAQLQLDAKDTTAYAPPAIYPSNQIEIQNSVGMGSAIVRFRSQSNNAAAGIWNIGAVPRTSSLVSDFIFQSRTANSTYSELARFSGNGGITFNGDTAQANALDDYEEGTWTPVIATESGSSYTLGSTYASYVKVGKLVYIAFSVQFTAIGSGTITIISLPFSRASGEVSIINGYVTSGNNRQSVQYVNYTSNYVLVRLDDGNSYINYWTTKNNWAATNSFVGTGVYETA
jgi:hypothetical protein